MEIGRPDGAGQIWNANATNCPRKNYLVKNIVDYTVRHKWTPTLGPANKYPPHGIVSVSFTHLDFDYSFFLGPNLSRQLFPTTQTVKPQQGRQQLMI